MTLDLVNGSFEGLGGCVVLLSCRRMLKDKEVKGISLAHGLFFLAWGFLNLAFYPSVGALYSFTGSVAVTVANGLWVWLMVYYKYIYVKQDAQAIATGYEYCDGQTRPLLKVYEPI